MTADLGDPTTVALLAAAAMEAHRLPYALYGGLLLAAYGEPRETRDADFAVVRATASEARAAFDASGIRTALAFADVEFGGLRVSRLTLLSSPDAAGLNTVDLIAPISLRYAEAMMARALRTALREREITVVAPEDFVLLKALSTRDRDLEDAASVVRRTSTALDLELVAAEVLRLAGEVPRAGVEARHREILRRADVRERER